jgi:hypothetical protein
MFNALLIQTNFTLNDKYEIQEENDKSICFSDIMLLLFVSYFFGNFIEEFAEYLRRPRNHGDDNDAYDMLDMMDILGFD